MSAVDKATLDNRVEQTVSQFNEYGNQRRNAEIFQMTHRPPTCQQRVRQEDPSRLTDPRHLELIVDKTWEDALAYKVSKMIGITSTPIQGSVNEVHQQLRLNLDKFPSTLSFSNDEMMMEELKNHLKVDMESRGLQLMVGSSTVNYQDIPVSDNQICHRLGESISSFFEKDEEPYKSMIQRSKSDWRDACHKRSIRDVETLLNTHKGLNYSFNPLQDDTDSYEEVSPSISLRATCSPKELESMLADAS
ncbi:hypothetical protein V865_001284 [Kwoniella europaea PYCC6329]|uniref:SNF2 N-terminal domain-containing protein n=1 Tax=Kwoniella europaea PYCC6329 TaxID=1423913 RepID=A0AAX4KCQ1_9TREE